MLSWRPADREPDALRATLHDYLRNRSPQVFEQPAPGAKPLGRARMVMSNGQTLVVDLRLTPMDVKKFGNRSAVIFEVDGHAAETSTGYEVRGRVVIDRETLAFLSIEANPLVVNRKT